MRFQTFTQPPLSHTVHKQTLSEPNCSTRVLAVLPASSAVCFRTGEPPGTAVHYTRSSQPTGILDEPSVVSYEPVGYEMSVHKTPLLRQQGNSGLAGSRYIILDNHLDQFLIITNAFRDDLTGRRQIPTIGHDK